MTQEDLENTDFATQVKGRRINLDLSDRASKAIEGLAKLAECSQPDFIRFCLNVGMKVVSCYECGGKAYLEDREGKKEPIPKSPKESYRSP